MTRNKDRKRRQRRRERQQEKRTQLLSVEGDGTRVRRSFSGKAGRGDEVTVRFQFSGEPVGVDPADPVADLSGQQQASRASDPNLN